MRFLAGYPGRFVVLARRSRERWYIAGINSDSAARNLTLDLCDVPGAGGTLITDGDTGNLSFRRDVVRFSARRPLQVTMPARGGFVLIVDPARQEPTVRRSPSRSGGSQQRSP